MVLAVKVGAFSRTHFYFYLPGLISCFPPAELTDEPSSIPASIAERYKVGRTLGDGNFAIVRECVERSTGREYALKIISKNKCRGKVSVLMFTWICWKLSVLCVTSVLYFSLLNRSTWSRVRCPSFGVWNIPTLCFWSRRLTLTVSFISSWSWWRYCMFDTSDKEFHPKTFSRSPITSVL